MEPSHGAPPSLKSRFEAALLSTRCRWPSRSTRCTPMCSTADSSSGPRLCQRCTQSGWWIRICGRNTLRGCTASSPAPDLRPAKAAPPPACPGRWLGEPRAAASVGGGCLPFLAHIHRCKAYFTGMRPLGVTPSPRPRARSRSRGRARRAPPRRSAAPRRSTPTRSPSPISQLVSRSHRMPTSVPRVPFTRCCRSDSLSSAFARTSSSVTPTTKRRRAHSVAPANRPDACARLSVLSRWPRHSSSRQWRPAGSVAPSMVSSSWRSGGVHASCSSASWLQQAVGEDLAVRRLGHLEHAHLDAAGAPRHRPAQARVRHCAVAATAVHHLVHHGVVSGCCGGVGAARRRGGGGGGRGRARRRRSCGGALRDRSGVEHATRRAEARVREVAFSGRARSRGRRPSARGRTAWWRGGRRCPPPSRDRRRRWRSRGAAAARRSRCWLRRRADRRRSGAAIGRAPPGGPAAAASRRHDGRRTHARRGARPTPRRAASTAAPPPGPPRTPATRAPLAASPRPACQARRRRRRRPAALPAPLPRAVAASPPAGSIAPTD